MLAIAFAILISCIIEAAGTVRTVTGLHAAVILDLSWMNNTSTWIWFLLYAHHLTKPATEGEGGSSKEREPVPAIWSASSPFVGWHQAPVKPLLIIPMEPTTRRRAVPTAKNVLLEARSCVSGRRNTRTRGTLVSSIPGLPFQFHSDSRSNIAAVVRRAWYFVSQNLCSHSVLSTSHSWAFSVCGFGAIHSNLVPPRKATVIRRSRLLVAPYRFHRRDCVSFLWQCTAFWSFPDSTLSSPSSSSSHSI
jgi:hypothetical protein